MTDEHAQDKPMDQALQIASRVLESSSAIISVVDHNHIYRSANRAYTELCGKPIHEILGHHVSEVMGEEAFRTWARPGFDRCFAGETVRFEAWIDYPSGGSHFMGIQYYPIWRDGRVEYAAVMSRDITARKQAEDARKQAEDALKESEELYRTLVEALGDAVSVRDMEGRYLTVNSGFLRMYGRAREEIASRTAEELFSPREASIIARDDQDVLIAGRTVETEEKLTDHLGNTTYHVTKVPLRSSAGGIVGTVTVSRDVTEHKLLEEQALRVERLETTGRIAAQVAHDFNNLLGPLTMYPDLIKLQLPEGHPAVRYCDAMLSAAQQMADINMDMIALSRTGHVERHSVDLNKLIEQVLEGMIDLPESLSLLRELAPDLAPINGAHAQLRRVVANLLTNAREAMHDVGEVRVRTDNVYIDAAFGHYGVVEEGHYVRMTVSDTGPGVPDEIRGKVFDPFFSTKNYAERRGSGLGLTIVQAVAQDHRGYVDLVSSTRGGTTFSVYFPVARETRRIPFQDAREASDEAILVVDDDPIQRDVLQMGLSSLGYRVRATSNAEEALSDLSANKADLLIFDMVMPGDLDGAETYRRALRLNPRLKAIIISGYEESDRVQAARALGASAFLTKPVDLKSLAASVRAVLATASQSRPPEGDDESPD